MPRDVRGRRGDLLPALSLLAGGIDTSTEGTAIPDRELHMALVTVLVRATFVELAEARGLLRALPDEAGGWPPLIAALRSLRPHGEGERSHLFDERRDAWLADLKIDHRFVAGALHCMRSFVRARTAEDHMGDGQTLGAAFEDLLGVEIVVGASGPRVEPNQERRRLGAHYTSRAIAEVVVRRTLAPLLEAGESSAEILALRVCDPAMGGGAFLLETITQLSGSLSRAWASEGGGPAHSASTGTLDTADLLRAARREVAHHCVRGVDKDPLAVDVARLALWLAIEDPRAPVSSFDSALRWGDSLLPASRHVRRSVACDEAPPFDWDREHGRIVDAPRHGFDAMVGNPPWVSYAGRAAQPLAPNVRAAYMSSPAFGGYRNLQSLFVHRAATLLRPGGRLGFLLPTSMSDLAGYTASRRAHDVLAVVDAELPDFGDSFDGVFQPCMALLSTKRPIALSSAPGGPWQLTRSDLDPASRVLLDRLDRMPRFLAETFGERGFQTTRGDVLRMREATRAEPPFTQALRTGTEVAAFRRKPPSLFADPQNLGARLRPAEAWREVKLLIRQTARYPMAALSDGLAFRNSVLAGFANATWSDHFLLGYLNASPVRFYHYMRHRDARQGMPQLKIGHLRALPAPRETTDASCALERLARDLGERNAGIRDEEQDAIDRLVSEILELGDAERARVAAWSRSVKR